MEAKVAKLKASKDANFDSSITSVQEKIEIIKELGLDFASSDIDDEEETEDEDDENNNPPNSTPNNPNNNVTPPAPTGGSAPTNPSSPIAPTDPDEEKSDIIDNDIDEEELEEIEPVEEGFDDAQDEKRHINDFVEVPDNQPNPDPKTPNINTSGHFPLAYPNYNAFYPVEENGETIFAGLSNIKEDTSVFIVQANTEVRNQTGEDPGYLAVMPVPNHPERFVLLGIMSKEEVAIHKETLDRSINPTNVNIYEKENIGDGESIIKIQGLNHDNIKGVGLPVKYSAGTSNNLKYRFSPRRTIPGKFSIPEILRK
jgi:hypothetical protein